MNWTGGQQPFTAALSCADSRVPPELVFDQGLGHSKCGAVDATLKGGTLDNHIASLVQAIQPAVDSIKGKRGDPLDLAVHANVTRVVQQLRASNPVLKHAIESSHIKVVGAVYDLATGKVQVLP
jgi:carbonic anhydrase